MYTAIDNAMLRGGYHWANNNGSKDKELVINHLDGHKEITTKTGLLRSLKYYFKTTISYVEQNFSVFETMPASYVVSSKLDSHEYY